jgi:hypothetical protein
MNTPHEVYNVLQFESLDGEFGVISHFCSEIRATKFLKLITQSVRSQTVF